jgi:hypothetical protein
MYGLSGERQLLEWEVPWLPGYQGAAPVRVGNAAAGHLLRRIGQTAIFFLERAIKKDPRRLEPLSYSDQGHGPAAGCVAQLRTARITPMPSRTS